MYVSPVNEPQKRRILRGYRQEFTVGREFEPVHATYVATAPKPSAFDGLTTALKLREELRESLRRETDERAALHLFDRITTIETAWGDQGIRVRRKILWF